MQVAKKIEFQFTPKEANAIYKVLGNIRTIDFSEIYKLTAVEVAFIDEFISYLPELDEEQDNE